MAYKIKTSKKGNIPKRYLITFGVTSVETNAKNKNEALKSAYIEQKKLTKIKEI